MRARRPTVQDGFFTGILDPHALTGVAESVGLDGRRVREILASNEYAARVRADRDEAMELGATARWPLRAHRRSLSTASC